MSGGTGELWYCNTGKDLIWFNRWCRVGRQRKPPWLRVRSGLREREIVGCLTRGASNKEIARELAIAESTVKIHVQHILRKLELASRVQVAVWASEHGIGPRP